MERNQILYIATTKNYSLQNKFLISGVININLLKEQFSSYNKEKLIDDNFYYCFIFKCIDYQSLENRIYEIFGYHIDINSNESSYHLPYNVLIKIIQFISNKYDEEIDYYYNVFFNEINEQIHKKSIDY